MLLLLDIGHASNKKNYIDYLTSHFATLIIINYNKIKLHPSQCTHFVAFITFVNG